MKLHDIASTLSRALILDLAAEIARRHPDHWGRVPRALLALKIREWVRLMEDCGIWEPDHIASLVRVVFCPAPEMWPPSDMGYVMTVMTNVGAGAEARTRSIVAALSAGPGAVHPT